MVQNLLGANGGTFKVPQTNYYQNETDTLKVAERDPGVHVIVLKGNGRAFSAGWDLIPFCMERFVEIAKAVWYAGGRNRQFVEHSAFNFYTSNAIAFDDLWNQVPILGGHVFCSDLVGFEQV